MTITLPVPDELVARLAEAGDVTRRALEAFGLAEYQAGRLTRFELRQLLGIETRFELDGFLKERGVYEPVTLEDVRQDIADLKAFGA